jgi:hypothetical membrane protein
VRAVARGATIALLVGSAGSLAALHVLRSDLDPVARRLSEYANGPYHVVMTAVFYAMGLALVTLSLQLGASQATGATRLVAGLIAVAGAGLMLSGIFETGSGSELTELVHSRASGTAVLSLTVAAVLHATHPAFDDIRRWDTAVRIIVGVAVVAVLISPILHDTRWSGIGQRFVWLALTAWLLVTAWQLPADA